MTVYELKRVIINHDNFHRHQRIDIPDNAILKEHKVIQNCDNIKTKIDHIITWLEPLKVNDDVE